MQVYVLSKDRFIQLEELNKISPPVSTTMSNIYAIMNTKQYPNIQIALDKVKQAEQNKKEKMRKKQEKKEKKKLEKEQ